MKRIILTGGGTAGHVTPNLALAAELQKRGYEILYIGRKKGIEKDLAEKAGLAYKGIPAGKLRRYLDIKNLIDPFRVLAGCSEAKFIIKKWKPDLVFSKGGFVSTPVVLMAGHQHVPAVIHESDMTPGLANRLCFRAAKRILCNFPETLQYLPEGKGLVSGSPIREELLHGSRSRGLAFTGFSGEKPVLLVIGGSSGSLAINAALREALPVLLPQFDIVHLCGSGNVDEEAARPGYLQHEYINEELPDLFAAADLVLSRAGANAVCELKRLCKPNLLIPLSKEVSRGDQELNAESFRKHGYSMVLEEKDLTPESLTASLKDLYERRDIFRAAMESAGHTDSVRFICDLLDKLYAEKTLKQHEAARR